MLKSGSVLRRVLLKLRERDEVRRKPVLQPRHVDQDRARDRARFLHIYLPCAPVRLKPLEKGLAVLCCMNFDAGLLTTKPEEVPVVQNERFVSVCEGTSQNQ